MATKMVSVGLSLLGLLVIAVMAPRAKATRKPVIVGGKSDIPNVEADVEVQELGRYCVEQFNHQQKEEGQVGSISKTDTAVFNPLTFTRVVSAQRQVVAGTKYFLRIEVTQPDGTTRMFDSVLLIQPWLQGKKLLGFTPVASPVS